MKPRFNETSQSFGQGNTHHSPHSHLKVRTLIVRKCQTVCQGNLLFSAIPIVILSAGRRYGVHEN